MMYFSHARFLKSGVYFTYSTSQHALATFHILSWYVRPVAIMLYSTGLTSYPASFSS